MNVGELLRERDRLLGVIEEAKTAKSRLKQLNVLITMYGDDEKVPVTRRARKDQQGKTTCPKCPDAGPFFGENGLRMHNSRVHTKKILAPNQGKAKRRTTLRRVS